MKSSRLYAHYGRQPRPVVSRQMPPTSRQLRQALERERTAAERQAARPVAADERRFWEGYYTGRAALARELLGLWGDGREPD